MRVIYITKTCSSIVILQLKQKQVQLEIKKNNACPFWICKPRKKKSSKNVDAKPVIPDIPAQKVILPPTPAKLCQLFKGWRYRSV